MDTVPEHAFDRCVFTAAQLCRAPIAFISLIDGARTWLKSAVGTSQSEFRREDTMCWEVVSGRQEIVVEDFGSQARFAARPNVSGLLPARFYFGVPLMGPNQHVIGSLCVVDTKPRTMFERQVTAMRHLAVEVSELLRMRVPGLDLEATAP